MICTVCARDGIEASEIDTQIIKGSGEAHYPALVCTRCFSLGRITRATCGNYSKFPAGEKKVIDSFVTRAKGASKPPAHPCFSLHEPLCVRDPLSANPAPACQPSSPSPT